MRSAGVLALRVASAAVAVIWLGGGHSPAAQAPPPLTVAAASDLQPVWPLAVAPFEKATGQTLRVTYGSSGNFFAQIQNGAPFDVFFSADIDHPKQLERAGLVEPGTIVTYAVGRIVLWTRKDSGIDLSQGLRALLAPSVRRIAIANPAHAPYGRAAMAALQHEGIDRAVRSKLVLGENVSQAAQFVQSGNADAGIVALSVALAPALKAQGVFWEVPATFHPPIEQGAAVLKGARDKALARRLLAFFTQPETTRLLQSFGFSLPAAAREPR